MRKLILILFFVLFSVRTTSASVIELNPAQTRFVAMRADKVNARSGPNTRYPIEWIYQQQNYPVEIIAEYEQWRKIRDYDGTITWVKKNFLTNTRYALITEPGENNIYDKDSINADVIAKAENGVVAKIKRCNQSFCYLIFENDIEGWMPRNNLYGIKKGEEIK